MGNSTSQMIFGTYGHLLASAAEDDEVAIG